MPSLDDFNNTSSNTLADFNIQPDQAAPVANRASNLNLAAHAAALSPNGSNLLDNYRSINAELDQTGQSTLANQIIDNVKQQSFDKARQGLIQVLSDPSISDEQKMQVANAVYDAKNPLYNHNNIVASEALEAPVANESVEAENSRVSVASSLNELFKVKQAQQALVNSNLASYDQSLGTKVAGILETMIPGVQGKLAGDLRAGVLGEDENVWSRIKGFIASGSAKADVRDLVQNTPLDKRLDLTQQVIDVVNNHPGIIMSSPNDFLKAQQLQEALSQGGYTNEDEWIDNLSSLMDLSVFGGLAYDTAKGFSTAASKAATSEARAASAFTADGETLAQKASNWNRDSVKTSTQPLSLSQTYKDTNADKFRSAHEAAASDKSDEASQALYGTSREDAIANDLSPEVGHADGSVKSKVGEPDGINNVNIAPDADVRDFVNFDGATQYTQAEKAASRADVVNDFQQAMQLGNRREMFQILHNESVDTPDGVTIKGVYGPQVGGYQYPQDAIELAKYALRDYGIDDSNFTLLRRNGNEYVPVDKSIVDQLSSGKEISPELNQAGDYLIQLDYNYKFNPADMSYDDLSVSKLNFFDSVAPLTSGKGGSLTRHLFDIASLLDPTITKSAAVAVDKSSALEKILLDKADKFSKQFNSHREARQVKIYDYLKKANAEQLPVDYAKLVGNGFTPSEIDTVKSWRSYWDNQYWLENRDLAKTLQARNYHQYIDPTNDTRLFAKPVSRQSVGGSAKILDVNTGSIRFVNSDELDALYKSGGTVAQLRSPMKIGDDAAELIVSAEKPGAGYLRAINDTTPVLNYRQGYYAVRYKDPHFIIKKVKNAHGETLYEKAVATAGTIKDAELAVRRMAATDGGEYYHRQDRSKDPNRPDSDHVWDLSQAGGRSAQRFRGKRLEDVSSNVIDPGMSHIEGPVESMINAARSISRRANTRSWIEATKQRAVAQYGDYFPKDDFGRTGFPSSRKDVAYRGDGKLDAKKLADARTTWEYVNYMEHGYINSLDDGIKAALNSIADLVGHAGYGKAEKAARWLSNGRGASGVAKGIAFNLYLATNPLRQFFVQAHQAVQLLAINPQWAARIDQSANQTIALIMDGLNIKVPDTILNLMGMQRKEFDAMAKAFKNSGLVASIDKQNLIRGSLSDMADQMSNATQYTKGAKQLLRYPGKGLSALRKVGFDAGEAVNMMTAWLAFRDKAIRAGKDVSKADVLDGIAADARNFTYNMNSAGDMPYNQNALSFAFQFQQQAHKAILTMTTNRNLTAAQKSRLVAFNLLMYGLPSAAVVGYFGRYLPDNQQSRDVITSGLEGAILNKTATLMSGENTRIDWSGISPANMYGSYDFIHNLFTSDVGTIVASTPSGQLFFGGNSRLTQFARTGAQYFNLVDNSGNPVQFSDVAKSFAKLSSGYSNAFKAAYALEYGKKINSAGRLVDENVSTPEAVAQAFGFTTLDEAFKYAVQKDQADSYRELISDVQTFYKNFKLDMSRSGISPQEFQYSLKLHSEAFRVWGNDNVTVKEEIDKLLRQDVANGDDTMYKSLMRATNYRDREQTLNDINNLPDLTPDQKEQWKSIITFIYDHKDKGEKQ